MEFLSHSITISISEHRYLSELKCLTRSPFAELVLCPAFVSDCLETLEEIEERGKEIFIEAGGQAFTMIPCLNVHPKWVASLKNWINEIAAGNTELLLNTEA